MISGQTLAGRVLWNNERWLPYIEPYSDFLNTYLVLGFGGNGIAFSVIGLDIIFIMLKNKKHYLSSLLDLEGRIVSSIDYLSRLPLRGLSKALQSNR